MASPLSGALIMQDMMQEMMQHMMLHVMLHVLNEHDKSLVEPRVQSTRKAHSRHD